MANWLLVDPATKTVANVQMAEFGDIARIIGCDWAERVTLSRFETKDGYVHNGFWVDEEGFLKDGLPVARTVMYPGPLAGKVLFGNWLETRDGDMEFLDSACPPDTLLGQFRFSDDTTNNYTLTQWEEELSGINVLHVEPVLK